MKLRARTLIMTSLVMISLLVFVFASFTALAQTGFQKSQVIIPSSSLERSIDIGSRAHTNVRVFVPGEGLMRPRPMVVGPPYGGYYYETPGSIACVYQLITPVSGCNPNKTVTVPNGGSKAIAIVDAYDDPNAARDLAYFSNQFGLPAPNFQVVYASGTQPSGDPG